jgi:hypothetical protein
MQKVRWRARHGLSRYVPTGWFSAEKSPRLRSISVYGSRPRERIFLLLLARGWRRRCGWVLVRSSAWAEVCRLASFFALTACGGGGLGMLFGAECLRVAGGSVCSCAWRLATRRRCCYGEMYSVIEACQSVEGRPRASRLLSRWIA